MANNNTKVYGHLLSQPVRALDILCNTLGVPGYEFVSLDLKKGEHKSASYEKINPFKKIPSFKDGDIIINESCAALRYIARKYDKSGQWYPSNIEDVARTDEYLDWQHTNTRKHGVGVFYNMVLVPKSSGKEADMELIRSHASQLKIVEEDLLKYFLANRPFIGGQKPSIADISACVELEQPIRAGYVYSEPIQDYMKRVKSEIGECYDKAHQILWDVPMHQL